jgi:hypothetical protein
MSVRGKFRVASVAPSNTVHLQAVCADELEENQRFHKYTPYGDIKMAVDNPPALAFFTPGKVVYVDFTEAV